VYRHSEHAGGWNEPVATGRWERFSACSRKMRSRGGDSTEGIRISRGRRPPTLPRRATRRARFCGSDRVRRTGKRVRVADATSPIHHQSLADRRDLIVALNLQEGERSGTQRFAGRRLSPNRGMPNSAPLQIRNQPKNRRRVNRFSEREGMRALAPSISKTEARAPQLQWMKQPGDQRGITRATKANASRAREDGSPSRRR
jgi:hypothetical protein